MTLLPIENWQVKGVDGPSYKVGPLCCHPECKRPADHAHHLWRRSFLNGDYSWVELPDGTVVGNLVALCVKHHDQVTGRLGGHEAAIRMTEDKVMWWCIPGRYEQGDPEWLFKWPLDPQPPAQGGHAPSPSDPPESERCPTCGRQPTARRSPSRPSHPRGERRRRKSFNIPVPADAEEDGAEVMETLIEDLAVVLGVEADKNGRYYVVVPALYFAAQERDRFRDSILGKGD